MTSLPNAQLRPFVCSASLLARGLQLPKEQLSTDSLQDIRGTIPVASVTVTQMLDLLVASH